MSDLNWKDSSNFDVENIPPDAVLVGNDSDGSPIYVGRTYRDGEHLPAKVVPNKRAAYICFNGKEVSEKTYELLCGEGFGWAPTINGSIPPRTVSIGTSLTGEPVYVGRANFEGSCLPGKIHPEHRSVHIPYGGQEISISDYEALVYDEAVMWVGSNIHSPPPPNAFFGGRDTDGSTIYLGRNHYKNDLLPGKVIPTKKAFYVCYNGLEIFMENYEILCGCGYSWERSQNGDVPQNAIVGGYTSYGENLYIGRTHYSGSLTPGKIHPSHKCLYIPYEYEEKHFKEYEVLVDNTISF